MTAERPKRRSLGQILRDTPGDWLFERSGIPGDVIGIAVMATSKLLGFGWGAVFAINWYASKIPMASNALRALWHRDATYWTRPQMRQPKDVTDDAMEPMETAVGAKGVPRVVTALTRAASRGNRVAAFFDDWLNERSRPPGIVIEFAMFAAGMFLLPIPAVILFPVITVVRGTPTWLAMWLALRNRDMTRYSRSGMRQRGDVVARMHESDLPEAYQPRLEVRGVARQPVATPRPPSREISL